MPYFSHFVIPFVAGTIFLFAAVLWKWVYWFVELDKEDKKCVYKGIFSLATIKAAREVFMESLLHRRIFKVNPLLGFMHMSLAFGWFLLIAVGWIEAYLVFDGGAPLYAHVFFRYFDPQTARESWNPFAFIMDALLAMILAGVALAWLKRVRSKALGMKRTTRHMTIDRLALTALWCIFPMRLAAESFMAAIKGNGGFLTGSIGNFLSANMEAATLSGINEAVWWLYSFALGIFFVAMPFSRYMHIFTEIPLIFLRRYKLKSKEFPGSYDNFQMQACSRCGICIDPCQLQQDLGINNVQSTYFLRDRRYSRLSDEVVENCLACGRCESKCPVGIELNALRLNSRAGRTDTPADARFKYLRGADRSEGNGKVGYFAGCMTLLTPSVLMSMQKIFTAAGEEVWWADKDGGVCCGRPMKLAGEVSAAHKIMEYNTSLFIRHNIKTLVTSCPICLKVFREDYGLDGVKVLHHTEYVLRLIHEGRLDVKKNGTAYTYHDPCELGRGSGIYDEPRAVIEAIGTLYEPEHNREDSYCCGSSLANNVINDGQQLKIGEAMTLELERTEAGTIITACPLCKKAVARNASKPVMDIAQAVAENISA